MITLTYDHIGKYALYNLDYTPMEAYSKLNKKENNNDYSKNYLTFEALEDGTFTLTIPASVTTSHMTSVSYSTDNGETWTTTNNTSSKVIITTPTITAGNKVLWKGIGKQTSSSTSSTNSSTFSATGNFNAYGNIMSLLYGDEFEDVTEFPTDSVYTFAILFSGNTKLEKANNLILPATTLTTNCYSSMFIGCTSLTIAPELPATTLANHCYQSMFSGCTSLTTAPSILPALTLYGSSYCSMFENCRSLVVAPELPATNVYSGLNKTDGSYTYMFKNCSKLNYIKAMLLNPEDYTTYQWVKGVASTGTFVKNSAATWTMTGNDGVPSGWTVETAST